MDCGGNNGWKIWHRLSIWPHFPLYSRAVPNHDKDAGCGKWQYGVPWGKHLGPIQHLPLQHLDLHAPVVCWDFGLCEWTANTKPSRNPWEASGNHLGGGGKTG
uniref:Solute carrier family 22 member 16 n=1 Tax=Rousettus aegyptiacus TaxID=9407 RepID=A0A7J8KGJ8_ROUAE|nr:solute carrier family 22 member 16 [Rousettus aegyptiacus]